MICITDGLSNCIFLRVRHHISQHRQDYLKLQKVHYQVEGWKKATYPVVFHNATNKK